MSRFLAFLALLGFLAFGLVSECGSRPPTWDFPDARND
jgi:hypothetical protein